MKKQDLQAQILFFHLRAYLELFCSIADSKDIPVHWGERRIVFGLEKLIQLSMKTFRSINGHEQITIEFDAIIWR